MVSTTIDGKSYYPASYVAEAWQLKESTIRRYASPSSGKLSGCVKHEGVLYVPADSIRPITKPIAQGLLWGIVSIKNDPQAFLDLTPYSIDNSKLDSVLDDLGRQMYLQVDSEELEVRRKLIDAKITEKGFQLIRYKKRMSENPLTNVLNIETITVALTSIQTVMQAVQLIQG